MTLLLLLLSLLIFLNKREKFVNVNKTLVIKNMDGSNKIFVNLTDYNNIDIGRIFTGAIKIKINIPQDFKAVVTYFHDDNNRKFAFNLELPNGEYILERNVRKTIIDKIVLTNVFGDVRTLLILVKDENGNIIYTTNRNNMINWDAIRFTSTNIKPLYGSNAMLPIYYSPPLNPINVRRIPHSYISQVPKPNPIPHAPRPRRRR
jgi:hypothetical protein